MRGLILPALLLWLPSGYVASNVCGGRPDDPCENLCLFPSSVEVSGRTVHCDQYYPPVQCLDLPDIRQYACANIRLDDGSRITTDSEQEELCKEMRSGSGDIFINSDVETDYPRGTVRYTVDNEWDDESFTADSLKWLVCDMQEKNVGESSDEDGGAVTLTFTGFVSLVVFGLLVNSFVNLRFM